MFVQIEDIMGLPSGMCCKSVGSLCGACPWCENVGIYMQKKTTYPGAVRFVPKQNPNNPGRHNPLRLKYKKEFSGVPGYHQLWNKTPADRMTLPKANASADKVLESLAVVYICTCIFILTKYILY